jgi:2-polyprenyl-3-methyl-5-hydroxy-6-metoxy-1,4-benzoquinol methylase
MNPNQTNCPSCQSNSLKSLFSKKSPDGNVFWLVECKLCSLVTLSPKPEENYLKSFYENHYFMNRTDRGYNNYYSQETRRQIESVWDKNLQDLNFDSSIANFQNKPSSLDIGCAAGYYVQYMQNKEFNSYGIDIAPDPTDFARNQLKLNIYTDEFLRWDIEIKNKFEVITLWATIEHLINPFATLDKIYKHLPKGGLLILSTCRWGILSKIQKQSWRFCNVPEHIYYFTKHGLINEIESRGFRVKKQISYGSGFTTKSNASILYKIMKKIMDPLVKWTNQGDMIALLAEKI